ARNYGQVSPGGQGAWRTGSNHGKTAPRPDYKAGWAYHICRLRKRLLRRAYGNAGLNMADSLKSGHVYWLSAVALIDVGACLAITSPDFTLDEIFAWALSQRAALLFVLAPVVLLLANFLGANVKASLVYFRGRAALPGHRAFSHYVNSDSRIDTK